MWPRWSAAYGRWRAECGNYGEAEEEKQQCAHENSFWEKQSLVVMVSG